MLDWDRLPRLLQDLCEGHGSYMLELFALDRVGAGGRVYRVWLCRGCYVDAWCAAGRPDQPDGR